MRLGCGGLRRRRWFFGSSGVAPINICGTIKIVLWPALHNNTQTWARLERSAAAKPRPAFSRFVLWGVVGSCKGKRDLSRLRMEQLRRENTAGVAVRLLRMKRRQCPAGRAQTGGNDDLSFMTSDPQDHGAFWHFPPRRARSLKARANHATHAPPNAACSGVGKRLFVFSFGCRSYFLQIW